MWQNLMFLNVEVLDKSWRFLNVEVVVGDFSNRIVLRYALIVSCKIFIVRNVYVAKVDVSKC